jgi:riboflavin biosynthesis pyrimidine reductase
VYVYQYVRIEKASSLIVLHFHDRAPYDKSRMNISSPEALLLTHSLRARHDAVLVGINTLQKDLPQLTARTLLPGVQLRAGRQPRPVVLDSRLRVTELEGRDIRVKKPIIFHCVGDADCATIHTAHALLDAVEGELVLCRSDSRGRYVRASKSTF